MTSANLPDLRPTRLRPARALLDHVIDHAGLFPPAKLSMADAVVHHACYLTGPQAYALGRFVLPIARLPEFEAEYARLPDPDQHAWRLSVLAGSDPAVDATLIREFRTRQTAVRIVAIETKAQTVDEVRQVTAGLPGTLEIWVEVPSHGDVSALIKAIKQTGCGAKLRTGGVTPEAFPTAGDVARFLRACHAARVTCKATAGLHHPVSGEYPLTYEAGGPRGRMFGFVNLFLAAVLIQSDGADDQVGELLVDGEPGALALEADAIRWRRHRFTTPQLNFMRDTLCRSFGSCSFAEPLTGLADLHWL